MNPDRMAEMIVTLVVLAIEVGLVLLISHRARQPVNPAKPRIFPYSAATAFLSLAILVTLAHTYSVYTGQRLQAKNKMPGQQQQQQMPIR